MTKVDFRDCNPCELGHQRYVMSIVDRLMTAIRPDKTQGEMSLTPILNRYKPIGSSDDVNFFTKRPCQGTHRSQVNWSFWIRIHGNDLHALPGSI